MGAPSGVSYTKDIVPIFSGCTNEQCHPPWTRDSTLNQPETECCDGRPLIQPGDPNGSYLVDKIKGHPCGHTQAMPLPPDSIDDTQIALIVGWVCEGAPEN
jgi:hypothetical protein